MSSSTYAERVVVLRKTKLGESDLIFTLLAEDGSQVRAVAKGARKPTSPFASRLELFSQADLLLARGRSLDIVKEARLSCGHAALRDDLVLSACASCGVELLAKVSQPGLESPRLFPLTCAALSCLEGADADHAAALAAAFLLKIFAFSGLRPSFLRCAGCGGTLDPAEADGPVRFSVADGGSLCGNCRGALGTQAVSAACVAWGEALMRSTFSEVGGREVDRRACADVLALCQDWASFHVGSRLRSLDFLMPLLGV